MGKLKSLIQIGKSSVQKRPSIVLVDLTYKCNFNCSFCFYDKKKRKDLKLKEWKDIIDQIKVWLGSVFIDFSGGEPLLNKDCLDILSYSKKCGLITSMSTNASLITKDIAKKIVNLNLYRIGVSIQGTKNTHKMITNKPYFEKMIRGIKLLIAEKIKNNSKTRIYARVIIHNKNLGEIKDILSLIKELGFDEVVFRPLLYSNELMKKYEKKDLWIKDQNKLIKVIDCLKEEKKRGSTNVKITNTYQNLDLFEKYYFIDKGLVNLGKPPCSTAFKFIEISCDGNIKNCCLTLGNIKDLTLKNIYKSNSKKIRAQSQKCTKLGLIGSYEKTSTKTKIIKAYNMMFDSKV